MMASQGRDTIGFLCSGSQRSYGKKVKSIVNFFLAFLIFWSLKTFFTIRYEMQDLHVTETLPQMVALSETYMQIYEQHVWLKNVG